MMKIFNHELLRALREHYKINQKRLSYLIDVGQKTISNWENQISTPNRNQLKLLAKIFKVEKNLFFEENLCIPAVIAYLPKLTLPPLTLRV